MKRAFAFNFLFPGLILAAFVLMAGARGPLCWNEVHSVQATGSAAEDGRTTQTKASAVVPDGATTERERLLGMGRELFFQKCGSCHDADGSKPMSDGPPLNQRKVSEERVSRMVDSRFKTANEEQRRAVKLHVNNFMKR